MAAAAAPSFQPTTTTTTPTTHGKSTMASAFPPTPPFKDELPYIQQSVIGNKTTRYTANPPKTNWSQHAAVGIRPMRTCGDGYTPAVLRPEPSPPSSKNNSFDSNKVTVTPSMLVKPGGQVQEDDLDILANSLSRSASEELAVPLGEVGDLPANAHWKPDSMASRCKLCHRSFSFFFRRHHCRRCGFVMCWECTDNTVPLDQNAHFHPDGHQSKACGPCYAEWKVIKKIRHSRTNSIAEGQADGATSSNPTTIPTSAPVPISRYEHDTETLGSMSVREGFGGVVWSNF